MVLGFVEDFTSNVILDNELKTNSSKGIALNSGVHPSLTMDNLLHFLPYNDLQLSSYKPDTTYNNFSKSKDRQDIVLFNGDIFQCIKDGTLGIEPGTESNWLKTNKESLLLKSFIDKVKEKVLTDLRLTKRLVNSQFLYEVGQNKTMLPNDYAAWVFEAKGTDYVKITLNEIVLQALTDQPVELYVINQGVLVDTLILHPQNGRVQFEKFEYTFNGPGRWLFAIKSQYVLTNNGYIDMQKYDGFVCYTATGTGNTPESSTWSYNEYGNGLGFNVSVSLDSDRYIDYNFMSLGNFIKAAFELMALQTFLHNSNNRSNRNENFQLDKELLMFETKNIEANTVAKRYFDTLKEAKNIIHKTFDTQLSLNNDDLEVEITSV
ncbi:hypothetical protein CMU89_17105 [Elizabethkingia anophelis]|nr:hypothetical protein [Elizabethkingia anophelis]MDV3544360.1 hypothetical protein [Elizabethkingia anophelis]